MRRAIQVYLSCLCVVSFCIFLVVPAFSQSDVGAIVGFVRDHSGAVVPDATVTIQNEGTNQVQIVTSDAQGRYTVPSLRPADYTMTAEAKGFKKFISTHNKLSSNTTLSRRDSRYRSTERDCGGDRNRISAAD